MFARFTTAHKPVARFFTVVSALWLAACTVPLAPTANVGGQIDTSEPVQVALLVPSGSARASDNALAQSLENAARLAIADLDGAQINLQVYSTGGGDPAQAAASARSAVDAGAQIIVGPLFAEAAVAAGNAVVGRDVNVLAFSNNPVAAGGNVFVLGTTFENTANHLVRYANRQGINRYLVVHATDIGGEAGRAAITNAVQQAGAQVVGTESYPLSQQGILSSSGRIASTARGSGAQAVFMTAGLNADLPILATALPDAGLDPASTQFIGLTRWDFAPQALAIPGLQGGLFAVPDMSTSAIFGNRFSSAYGSQPLPLAGLAYDSIAAIGALVATGDRNALTKNALTTPSGFQGTAGVFRLLPNGLSERALAIATIQNNQVVILEQAPRSFGAAGF